MYGEPNITPRGQTVERLLSEHKEMICRFIGRRSGSAVLQRTTVDDLYQETAIAALANAEDFEFSGDASFVSWITTIARRVIAYSLRGPRGRASALRIRGRFSSGTGVSENSLYSPCRTPSSAVAGGERSDSLLEVIGKLPAHYRTVLLLHRIEERPLAEVAARMKLSKGATAQLIARAMAMLRERLMRESS